MKQKLHIYLHDSSRHYIICQFYQIISCHRKMPECYTKVKGRKLNGYCPKNSNLIVPFKITCFCTFKSEVAPRAARGHLTFVNTLYMYSIYAHNTQYEKIPLTIFQCQRIYLSKLFRPFQIFLHLKNIHQRLFLESNLSLFQILLTATHYLG